MLQIKQEKYVIILEEEKIMTLGGFKQIDNLENCQVKLYSNIPNAKDDMLRIYRITNYENLEFRKVQIAIKEVKENVWL